MIKEFEGKVAVITGGASGIGLGLAKVFAERGMKLILADVNKDALDKVCKDFRDINVEVMGVMTDVSKPDQVAHLADVSYERFGHVNILCNNAGIGAGGPIRFLSQDDWNWTIGVNLYGVIYGIQYFINRMINSREPCHIINTSSLAGLVPGDTAPYSASKSAVITLSEALALECFSTNVSVSVICPAHVRSNILENSIKLSQARSGVSQSPADTEVSGDPNTKKLLEVGMDPEFMAKLVINAIENDIFYIFTHPEYIPALKARFERIYDDTQKLHEKFKDQKIIKTNVYRNDTPAFTVTYPDHFIDLNPGPMTKAIFIATYSDCNLEIFVSSISPKRRIEELPKKIVRSLNIMAKDIEIISNEHKTLKDGTPAYETIIDYKVVGIIKVRSIHLSVLKDGKWIRVSVNAGANNIGKDLTDILQTLEMK
ncbi:MAG: SDR family NAD(P)-dependent oxidoreductase [Promethearchaeota archaeon]|jgi:NAD(P)-dependent dehydrogenase (short-subunit alcohol dehydrogenase family)